jgi:pantoate--beta-alanine ligase
MEIVNKIIEIRKKTNSARADKKTIGLVPTMGALHEGHISLIKTAVKTCDFVVVSIFVNPTQFGEGEDFNEYPRDLQSDSEICEKEGVELIFAPTADDMYPQKQLSWITVEQLTKNLCGASRSGHFRGVCTICTKLFNIIQPDIAFFGQKDFQQAVVIKRMVADLNMPLEIQVCPTVRESNGLAVSSRNQYLSPEQMQNALLIYESLCECKKLYEQGVTDTAKLRSKIEEVLKTADDIEIDYINLVDTENLEHIRTAGSTDTLAAVAVKIGSTRLIDNIILESS